jgi:hypothetical protein
MPRDGGDERVKEPNSDMHSPSRDITDTGTSHPRENEVTILARILGDGNGRLPDDLARYILDLRISERDEARMHDLAVRNQDGALTPAEKEELIGFAKAASLLSILKSKARRALGIRPGSATPS